MWPGSAFGSGWRKLECRHAQRREDVLVDIVVERIAGNALHDVAGKRGRVVRIGRRRARREDPVRDPALHDSPIQTAVPGRR